MGGWWLGNCEADSGILRHAREAGGATRNSRLTVNSVDVHRLCVHLDVLRLHTFMYN